MPTPPSSTCRPVAAPVRPASDGSDGVRGSDAVSAGGQDPDATRFDLPPVREDSAATRFDIPAVRADQAEDLMAAGYEVQPAAGGAGAGLGTPAGSARPQAAAAAPGPGAGPGAAGVVCWPASAPWLCWYWPA